MILFDKEGKEYNIPHRIDVQEWLATGKYFKEDPKAKAKAAAKAKKDAAAAEAAAKAAAKAGGGQ